MKISIVIPVYNVKAYLPECVASVRKLRGDLQFVLVDDGSTDGSGALCDALAAEDDRILVVHQKNGGLSEARNTGIRSCDGDFVAFLDSDDLLDPAETERMLAQLTPQTEVLAGCYRNYYPDTGELVPENCGEVGANLGEQSADRFLEIVPADGRSYYMIACRFLLNREFLLRNHLFFLPGIYHEDEEWTQRVLCAADRVLVTDCFFYLYRQGRAGAITSGVKPKHLMDCLTIINKGAELLEKQALGSPKARYLAHRMGNLYLNILLNMRVLEGETRSGVYRELSRLRRSCAPHMSGFMGRTVGMSQRLLGTRSTCGLLALAKKFAKK